VDHKVDVVFLRESLRGRGPVYVFGDAAVEMRETEATTLQEALETGGKGADDQGAGATTSMGVA
jgi:hypothetical protein